MATDWLADIKKHASNYNEAAATALVKNYRLVLSKPDTAYVAFSDPSELNTVKKNFLKGKLGLTESDEVLDAAIQEVGTTLKGVNKRSRATVYYLLADKFNKLSIFG